MYRCSSCSSLASVSRISFACIVSMPQERRQDRQETHSSVPHLNCVASCLHRIRISVIGHLSEARLTQPASVRFKLFSVFDTRRGSAFPPKSERRRLKVASHHSDDLRFRKTGLRLYLFKSHAIRPGRPDDPIDSVFVGLGVFRFGERPMTVFAFHVLCLFGRGFDTRRVHVLNSSDAALIPKS